MNQEKDEWEYGELGLFKMKMCGCGHVDQTKMTEFGKRLVKRVSGSILVALGVGILSKSIFITLGLMFLSVPLSYISVNQGEKADE